MLLYSTGHTRTSPIVEMAALLAECAMHNLRCLAFCRTRKLSELVLTYAREMLHKEDPALTDTLAAYRAGCALAIRQSRNIIPQTLPSSQIV